MIRTKWVNLTNIEAFHSYDVDWSLVVAIDDCLDKELSALQGTKETVDDEIRQTIGLPWPLRNRALGMDPV